MNEDRQEGYDYNVVKVSSVCHRKCPPHLFSPIIRIIIEEIRKTCKKQPLNCGFNSTDNAYEPLKLMQAVMAKTNEVCLRYLDNSMLCSLPPPSNVCYETSIYAMRNKRRKMEDRHVAIHDLNTMFNIREASPSSYYAIFDGHAGHDAAAYSSAHLHQFLAENKYFISNPEQALLDAFCKTDALFLEKCKVENLSGGTTAVVALLRPKEKTLYIAWVGDSQALLVKQGKILQCVDPHKPCRQDERERIEKAGGCVMLWGTWRVNGQLAVSRAIGDADYKPHVIAIPDVREISLDGCEDFLIVACDGLWDFLTEDAAAQQVYHMIVDNPDDTERISKNLVHLARYEGSADNISVIVVFLKEPRKIAAEAHRWATINGPPLTTDNMEAGLDNANNPFTNSNGSLKNLDVETDNIHLQKSGDGLLLNLTDNFKANGTELSQDIFEKSNGTKKSSSDIHFDDGFGPETDVDAVDDAFSPVEKSKTYAECLSKSFNDEGLPKSFNDEVKAFSDGLANNNPLGDNFNPFLNKEIEDKSEKDRKEDDFEEHGGDNREETPTPPVDTLHDAGGLEENPAESDSEDEWNYYKGDQAKPETLSLQPETVVETSELEDAMSQLNPNAAEFVPVSPTRSIPSPASRALLNDEVISQSPKRPVAMNIRVPNETEFEKEVKSRPSDFDTYSNGHDSDSAHNISGIEQIENILNGKSVDEIPEFQPGSTPSKQAAEEFHFGPNAAPFTPRLLDQSEALSTKANFGDDTEQTLNTSFNDSDLAIPFKDVGDPMSLSFSATRGDTNPFQDNDDLNKVHDLPDDIDEFLQDIDDNKENIKILDDTISDLPEHDVLGHLDNDRAAVQTTDLDKMSQDDEKELASPLEQDDVQALLGDLNAPLKSFESTLPKDFVVVAEKRTTDDSNISSLPELEPIEPIQDVLLIPEPQLEVADSRVSPLPTQSDLQEAETLSPVPDEVSDLSISPIPEAAELLESKTPVPIEEQETMQQPELGESRLSPLTVQPDLQEAKPLSPSPDLFQPKSEISEEAELLQAESPIYIDDANKLQQELSDLRLSPLSGHHEEALSIILESKSPVSEVADLLQSKSPVPAEQQSIKETDGSGGLESQGPACGLMSEPRLPLVDDFEGSTSVCEFRPTSDMLETEFNPKSEVENLELEAKSPGLPEELAVSPIPEVACHLAQHIYVLPESHSPFDSQHEKQEEEVTSSIKDDISSPIELLSPVKSPEVLLEDSFNEEDIKRAEPEAVIIDDSFSEIAQEVPKTDAPPQEVPSRDLLGDLMCPLPSLRPHVETEPPVPKNVFSMFKASAPFEPSSFAELSDGLNNFASDFSEQFSIKTDNIKPEFAEPAVITPSEDSKVIDEVPLAFLGEVPVQAPPQIVETSQEAPKELPVLAPLPIVPVEVKEVQKEIKKSGTASPPKKPIGKVGSSKSITAAKAPATTKATARPAASSSRTAVAAKVPSKTGPPKHTPTATRTTTSTIAATKLSPKPKTPAAPRPIEKKPLTNGDVKPAPRTTLTKRPASSGEVTATKTTTRTAAVAPIAKTSPSKMTAARPLTAPRAAPPKTASTNAGAPKPPASTTMAPKPRVPLASRTTTTGTATARLVSSTTTAKTPTATTNRTSLSPKTSTAPPKPKTLTYATPKPRMPLTKTITKSADVEKEKKESANKLTASRVTTVTKTTSGTATSRTATTTLKKTETKPLSNRTALSKTSTTTRTTTVSKKPGEIKSVTKTKTTKVEKPKENGVAPTSITEEIKEITIVNNVVNETENLIKDNSPLDNKLITETSNALIDINPAD